MNNSNDDKSDILEVYTDANTHKACIAIEKPDIRTKRERRFDLIVIKNRVDNLFEAEAVKLALNYVSEGSHIRLYCDKEGDIQAIKTGNARRSYLKTIISQIREIEKEKHLKVEYEYVQRKKNYAGRLLDKIR